MNCWSLLLVCIGVTLVNVGVRAASAVNDTPVKLSPFEVRANSVEFKRWIKIGSPNFVIYTDASEAEARKTLRKFELLRWAGQPLFGRTAMKLGPVTVIMPTARSDWRKLENKDALEWESTASAVGLGLADAIIVQHDWQDEGLGATMAMLAHADTTRLDVRGPFWFGHGLASMYEMVEFDGNNVVFGRASPRTARFAHAAHWLPWARFFAVERSSREYVKEDTVGQYTGQACVFTHYLFTNEDRSYIGRLAAWLDHLNAGHPPTEEHFQSVFGQDWTTWQRTMYDYVNNGKYRLYTVRVPPEAVAYTESIHRLPVAEMRELFVLAQILLQEVPASDEALDGLLEKGIQSDCLRELLAAACLRRKRPEAALGQLQQLITAGSANPRVYATAAELQLGIAADAGRAGRLGREADQARKWLVRAVELEPRLRTANESLAYVEAFGPEVDQHSIATIELAYQNLRGRAPTHDVIVALAMATWRIGDADTAKELAAKVSIDSTAGRETRALAQGILESAKAGRSAEDFRLSQN